MSTRIGEPTSDEEVVEWELRHRVTDPFKEILEQSAAHRDQHGCDTFSFSSASLLGTIAAATDGTRRILEVGYGLGYSGSWLAYGAGRDAVVDTVERDPAHAEFARGNLDKIIDLGPDPCVWARQSMCSLD